MVCGYLAGVADAYLALRRSVDAYNDIEQRHSCLHSVGTNDMDLSTTILGHEQALPFFLTLCAGQRMFHADGEVATTKAAKKHGLHMAPSKVQVLKRTPYTE
jgi:L-lactate dehydrogenase (cytochrome)